MSCRTTPNPEPPPEPEVDLAWPAFPEPDPVAFLPEGTTVEIPESEAYPDGKTVVLDEDHTYMPLDYWLRITDYVIEVRRVRAVHEAVYGPGSGADDSEDGSGED